MRKSIFITGIANTLGLLGMIFAVCFILGCPGLQIQGNSQELVVKMSARHVGHKLAVENPDVALMLAPLAEMVLTSPTAYGGSLISQLRAVAVNKIRDPLLKADISDLVGLIKIDGPTIAVSQVRLIRAIANGLLEGINMKGGGL